jgi:hypothetical protein
MSTNKVGYFGSVTFYSSGAVTRDLIIGCNEILATISVQKRPKIGRGN